MFVSTPITAVPRNWPPGSAPSWLRRTLGAGHCRPRWHRARGTAWRCDAGQSRPAAPPPGLTSASCPLPARAGWLAHAMEEYAQGYTDPPQGYLIRGRPLRPCEASRGRAAGLVSRIRPGWNAGGFSVQPAGGAGKGLDATIEV